MRFTADCAPCLMRRVLFQSRLEGNGREFESVKAAVDALSEGMDPDTPSVVIATDVHSRAYAALGSDDPYRRIKEEADGRPLSQDKGGGGRGGGVLREDAGGCRRVV